jgi:hypothetical protein
VIKRGTSFALAAAGALLVLAMCSAPNAIAAGAMVTVRAVGSSDQPVLPLAQVSTNEVSVVKDGNPEHSCAGTSTAGALQLASKGQWAGGWSAGFGYGVETIEDVDYPLGNQDRWAFWLNDQPVPSGTGVCGVELSSGDSVLFFSECVSKEAGVCPSTKPSVLAIEAPATVEVRQPVTVTVLAYPGAGGAPTPAKGVTVVGGGDTTAPLTDEQGQTTLVFAGEGQYALAADGAGMEPAPISAEAFVCAHEGNDGACGTALAAIPNTGQGSVGAGPGVIVSSRPPTPKVTGSVALADKTIAVRGGHTSLVKLECLGSGRCHGRLTMFVSAKRATKVNSREKTRSARTVKIAAASFWLEGDTVRTVKADLNSTGRALLNAARGSLGVSLEILELAPGNGSQTKTVHLVQQKKPRR